MTTAAEALEAASQRFAKGAKEHLNLDLDGSWKSILIVAAALQRYHAMFKKAADAKDIDRDKFVEKVAIEATAYLSTVFIKSHAAKLDATEKGLILTVSGVKIPISDLMREEVRTGKPNSLLLLAQVDEITKKNQQAEAVEAGNLEEEARKAAAVAVEDVRGMLKVELDYSRESLVHVDRALERLKAMVEISPENKSNLIRASCEKYGSYIGEVMARHMGGTWNRFRLQDRILNAVGIGPINAVPALIVEAILNGKSLSMGEGSAATVVDFVAKAEGKSKTTTKEGLFRNLDTAGEVPKRIPQFLEEARRIAKVNHNIDLDGTLFSLAALDEVIVKERQRLESERKVLNDENFNQARAFSVLPLGVYLGEAILSAHKGSWEELPGESWMRIRQHMIKLDPLSVVAALLRGETSTANDKMKVASAQQYYQGVRPMLADIVEAKLCGTAGTREQLLLAMGKDQELNGSVAHFAESCMVFCYSTRGVELDFSEKSLAEVDRILEEFHGNRETLLGTSRITERDLVNWFGCYAGEVFRRELGGQWVNEASGIGGATEKITHLNVNGNRIFVVSKVWKFLNSGPGDSLAFLLHATRSTLEQQPAPAN